jgi:hypothetical protein
MYGYAFVVDAYHVIIECPLYETERAQLCSYLCPSELLQAYGRVANLWELCISLLCPNSAPLASKVGSFLMKTLVKRALFDTALMSNGNVYVCDSKWMASMSRVQLRAMQIDVRNMYINYVGPTNWQRSLALSTWALSNVTSLILDMSPSKPIVEWLPEHWRDNIGSKVEHEHQIIDTYGLGNARVRRL